MQLISKKLRSLTISSLLIKSQWTKSHSPKLILAGKWLDEAGFSIGEKVILEIENEKIIIKKTEI